MCECILMQIQYIKYVLFDIRLDVIKFMRIVGTMPSTVCHYSEFIFNN